MFIEDDVVNQLEAFLFSWYLTLNEIKIKYDEFRQKFSNSKIIDLNEFRALKETSIQNIENLIPVVETEKLGKTSETKGGSEEMPKPLKYGQGTILERKRKRKDGSLYIYYEGRYYVDKKQKSVTDRTRSGCEKKLANLRAKYISLPKTNPLQESGSKIFFNDWLDEWYKTFKEPYIKANTRNGYKKAIKKIKSYFDNKHLNKVSYDFILPFINSAASSSAVKYYNILNEAFSKAIQLNKIKINPMSIIPKVKHNSKKRGSFNSEQQKILLTELEPGMSEIMRFLMCTGLRIGEYQALDKSCICDGYIKISQTYVISNHSKNSPKSKKGFRNVPIINSEFDLEKLIPSQYTYWQIESRFTKIRNKYFDENLTLHSTRHTFASLCYKAGIEIKKVQSWLGHESISTTMDIYTDLINDTDSPIYEYILKLKEKY